MPIATKLKSAYKVNYQIRVIDFTEGSSFEDILRSVENAIRRSNMPASRRRLNPGDIIKEYVEYKVVYYYNDYLKLYGITYSDSYPEITSFDVEEGSLVVLFTIQFFDALLMAKDILDFVEYFNRHLEYDFKDLLKAGPTADFTVEFDANSNGIPDTYQATDSERSEGNTDSLIINRATFRFSRVSRYMWLFALFLLFLMILSIMALMSYYNLYESVERDKIEQRKWVEEKIRDEKINFLLYKSYVQEPKLPVDSVN